VTPAPAFEEHDLGLSWLADEGEMMQRACHAVRLGGTVWVVDPVDVPGLDERIASVGEPAGVLQLLDRHDRDCAVVAERFGIPHHRIPFGGVDGAGFETVTVIRNRLWNEVAIWSAADRALVVPEAVGSAPYFRSGDEAIGVHPFLRLIPPRKLSAYEPVHLLTGHGTGMHGPGTPEALRDALDASRRRLPGAMVSMIRPKRG
jgi:hypothetical protein